MSKGTVYPSESIQSRDERTGAIVRQVTNHPSIHHHPFFFIPAYDDSMQRLVFVSHRTGSAQIFAEDRQLRKLVQMTDRPDINEWSVYPSPDGRSIYFTAGAAGWRLDTSTLREERLVDFNATSMRDKGMVGSAMGTTALSRDGRWWAVSYKVGEQMALAIISTQAGTSDVILERDQIAHMQFCPDDSGVIFYAGPLTDRVWIINRDGTGNRRVYQRDAAKREWITHETWIPGTRELAFVDWPHGMRCVNIDTGAIRRVTEFNAWHAASNRDGSLMVADTNFPDIGLQLFDPRDGVGSPRVLCHPEASSQGDHWNGPFPYERGPIEVHAPQHTHPHPSFSPDGSAVVFTSDRSGSSQVYEVQIPPAYSSRINFRCGSEAE